MPHELLLQALDQRSFKLNNNLSSDGMFELLIVVVSLRLFSNGFFPFIHEQVVCSSGRQKALSQLCGSRWPKMLACRTLRKKRFDSGG